MGFTEAYPDRLYSSRSRFGSSLRIGCLMCPGAFTVECSGGAAAEIRDLASNEVPVSIAESQTANSSCGLNALNGLCKPSETMDVIREMVRSGEVQDAVIG